MNEKRDSSTDWPAIILLLVGAPLAFTFFGPLGGLLGLVIGVVLLGWNKRNKGPLPTRDGE